MKALLDHAYVIGIGSDVPTLSRLIIFALNGKSEPFARYLKPVTGANRSIRLFGRGQFHESVPTPKPLTPEDLATMLMKYSDASQSEDHARYPRAPSATATKGWTISKHPDIVDGNVFPLIIAYATWIQY